MGMGAGTAKGTPGKMAPGDGFRVFRIKASSALEAALAALYKVILEAMAGAGSEVVLPHKDYLYYKKEFLNMLSSNKPKRRKGRRRKQRRKWRTPPIPLLAQFRWRGRVYGAAHAVCRFDLDRGVLTFKGMGIAIPLKRSLVEALIGELELSLPPKFTVFLTCTGGLRLVARRSPLRWWSEAGEECDDADYPAPFAVFALDVNSRNGLAILGFEVGDRVRMVRQPMRVKPPRKEWGLVSALQSYKDSARSGRSPSAVREKYGELREIFPASVPLTPSKAKELLGEVHGAHAARVREWERQLVHYLRGKIREHGRVVIVVDKPDPESLRGTPLQNTILRVCRRLENLCRYEGALYMEVRASGQYCPLCGREGVEAGWRHYRCSQCGLVWNRDYNACIALIAKFLEGLGLAERLRAWLREHPSVLAPSFEHQSPPFPGPCRFGGAGARGLRARDRGSTPATNREVPLRGCAPATGR
ncbi:MAG: zinc ribbon domain-containing protein [Thermofilum sp.]